MTTEELRARLCGVIAFPVTSFKPDLSLDLPGLRKNLRGVLRHPMCAVVAAGALEKCIPLLLQSIVRL
jgi:dihydrodipicolinate synthase/N-acetylneuraminate lyase